MKYEKYDQIFYSAYLKTVNTEFPFDFDQAQDLLPKNYTYPFQDNEPQEIKTDPIAFVHTPTPCKIIDIYKPLILPHILCAFPENYYKYLPRFDGEYGIITDEKQIQSFEIFLNLF